MISILTAHQVNKLNELKKNDFPASSEVDRKSPMEPKSDSALTAGDYCCILCGFKESSVEQLKEHINMHFISQVKKRKADKEERCDETSNESAVISPKNDCSDDSPPKKIKQEDDAIEQSDNLSCGRCDISLLDQSTFDAHIKFYCRRKKEDKRVV